MRIGGMRLSLARRANTAPLPLPARPASTSPPKVTRLGDWTTPARLSEVEFSQREPETSEQIAVESDQASPLQGECAPSAPAASLDLDSNLHLGPVKAHPDLPLPLPTLEPPSELEPYHPQSSNPAFLGTSEAESSLNGSTSAATLQASGTAAGQPVVSTPVDDRKIVPGALTAAEAMAAPEAQIFLASLSAEQRVKLHEVLSAVHDGGGALDSYSSATYARFAVHHSWDMGKTLKQVAKTVAWRTRGDGAGVDQMRAELLAGVPFFQLGGGVGATAAKLNIFVPGYPSVATTRAGDPFEVCAPGRIGQMKLNGQGLLQATTDAEFWTSNLAFMEYRAVRCDVLCARGDGRLKSLYMLSDVGGFSFQPLFMRKLSRRLTRTAPIADAHYPLYLRKSVLVNVPTSFSLVHAMLEPFLSKELTATLRIFDAARKAHKLLAADVDLAHVPACYGGSLQQLPLAEQAALGLLSLDENTLRHQFQGPVHNLGGFHQPPEERAEPRKPDTRRTTQRTAAQRTADQQTTPGGTKSHTEPTPGETTAPEAPGCLHHANSSPAIGVETTSKGRPWRRASKELSRK